MLSYCALIIQFEQEISCSLDRTLTDRIPKQNVLVQNQDIEHGAVSILITY